MLYLEVNSQFGAYLWVSNIVCVSDYIVLVILDVIIFKYSSLTVIKAF